ncbi:MAG: DUF819 family protein [Pirellulales bacterium]
MYTLIKPDDTWLLWTVIVVGVAASIWLEQTFAWAAKLSGPVLALCIAMVLANSRVMPPEAPVYEVIMGQLVPLALPLLLFRANVVHIVRSTGWLFVAFHLASLGTVVGALVAAAVLHERVANAAPVAAIMTASYIGGAVNFIAVARSYEVTSNETGPLLVADNFIMAGMFIVLILICRSKWARRWYPHPHTADAVDSRALAAEHWRRKEIALLDIAAAMAVAVTIVAAAGLTADLVQTAFERGGRDATAIAEVAGNRFVHITAWSTLVASVFHRLLERIHGAEEMGAYLLYVFLFVIGLPADLWTVLTKVPIMFVFCLVIAVVNLAFALVGGRLLGLNLEDIALAVNASLGGPPSAAAMAISMGWSKLVLPALLVGIWGYTIGTAVGLAVGELLSAWL